MKFTKGLITTGIIMMYQDNNINLNKRKMMKQGKQFVKKMGVI